MFTVRSVKCLIRYNLAEQEIINGMKVKKFIRFTTILFIMIQLNAFGQGKADSSGDFYLYVGAYSQGDEEGIYVYKFDATQGDLNYLSTAKGVANPSYLAIHPKRNLLIAANEIEEYNGEKTGSISSFAINPDGSLNELSKVPSGGGAPCYVSIDKTASWVLISNYSGGNVTMFPIEKDGKLKPYTDLKLHEGSGPVKDRQDKAYAHSVVLDPKENFALAVDLGMDKVVAYQMDKKNGKLQNNAESNLNLAAGAGPRHLTFHPNKKLAFVISELNSTITSCTYDSKSGKLTELMVVDALPAGFSGESYCADIHVSPDGKFLYGSNRGHDSIVIYKIDQKTGELAYIDHHSVHGKWPRNFVIDPTGKFLLVANQHSNNIVVFKIDTETGKLRANGVEVKVTKPVCLKMMEMM